VPHRSRLSFLSSLVRFAGLAVLLTVSTSATAQTYWFENYERAVALIDDGLTTEASALLERVIRDHPLPVSCLKVPGDRCIDYIPYFQRARIQVSRGDARGAAHSLDVTEAFGVGVMNKRTEKEVVRLRQQIRTMDTGRAGEPATVSPAVDQH
jgi:hypothetical protein